jgi:hypothetical protein
MGAQNVKKTLLAIKSQQVEKRISGASKPLPLALKSPIIYGYKYLRVADILLKCRSWQLWALEFWCWRNWELLEIAAPQTNSNMLNMTSKYADNWF